MTPVHAYIDPSVMTYAIQAVAGIAIALGTVVGIYWRKILQVFRKVFRVKGVKYKNEETNEVSFTDPKSDNVIITPFSIAEAEIKARQQNKFWIENAQNHQDDSKHHFGNIKSKVLNCMVESLAGILLSAGISFMLCYYAPLEMYMNNQDEFWFDYNILNPQLQKMTVILFALLFLVFMITYLLNRKFYYYVLLFGSVVFVSLYLHGNYYCSDLPAMDGTEIDWNNYLYQMRNSIFLCLIVLFIYTLMYRLLKDKKFSYVVDFTSILIVCMLCVSLVDITGRTNGKGSKTYDYLVSTNNEFDYSNSENFIIIVVDAYDAETFSTILNEDPEYQNVFDGFTYYPDTVSAYPFTSRSIPFILSGEWFENQTDFKQFEANAIHESPLLGSLEDNGYRLDVYEDAFLYDIDLSRFSNLVSTKPVLDDVSVFRKDILNMALYKYAPYFAKSNFEVDLSSFSENVKAADNTELFSMNNQQFYNKVVEGNISVTEDKVFKFIHLEGAHVPFNYDENMSMIEDGTYEQKEKAVIKLLNDYFTLLKQNDLYDNSTIIVMGDHGYDPSGESIERRCNALMLVKAANESHELLINDAVVSYDDLQGMYQNMLNGMDGYSAFEGLTEDNDARRFLSHTWTNENIITEYYQYGFASDIGTMIPTGNTYITDDTSNNEGQ